MPGGEFTTRLKLKLILSGAVVLTFSLFPWNTRIYGSETNAHLYVTGTVMETDRCASAWLIKRHVDPEAEFAFLTDEELMESRGISFDTPYSEFRRTHRASTFESIMHGFALDDRRVVALADLIHDIEINFWNTNLNKEAAKFDFELKQTLTGAAGNTEALQRCFAYLDSLAVKIE